jgi:hypothetical protein
MACSTPMEVEVVKVEGTNLSCGIHKCRLNIGELVEMFTSMTKHFRHRTS